MPPLARLVPLPCPDCSVPLPDPVGQRCPRCGLLLAGPEAARLYDLDQRLSALRAERTALLDVLRAASRGQAHGGAGAWSVPAQATGGGSPAGTPPPAGRTPQQVLLGLGALLVLVATTVFLAVVWLTIGLAGQAAVMVGLVVAAGSGAAVTARRGLGSTAATLAWLAAGLTAVAVRAGRDLGLPVLAALTPEQTVALAAAVGTGLAALAAARTRIGAFAAQAVLASGLVVPPLLLGADAGPAPFVAAVGGWGLLALAAHGRARSVHPAAGVAAVVGGALALVLAVGQGLVLAAVQEPGSAATAAVTIALLVAVLGVSLHVRGVDVPTRGVPAPGADTEPTGAVPSLGGNVVPTLAAPALGAALTLLALRTADAAGGSPAVALTATGVAALLAAGALLAWGRQAARWWALAVAVCGALALAHALEREAHGHTALLALAAAVAAAAVAALRDGPERAAAIPVAAGGLVAAGVAALLEAEMGTRTVVVAAGALAAVCAAAAAVRRGQPDEPGLAAVAGLTLLGALALALEAGEPALTLAGLLAAGGLVALAYACLPRRGQVAPLGVALSAGASWTLLGSRDVDLLEAYTLPVAALLLVVGLVRWHRAPDAPSWTTVGPAAALALVPSAQRALSDPHGLRALLVTAAAVVVLLVGLQLRAQALVVTAGLVVLEMALLQVGEAALFVPRWLVLGTLGALLLAAGATYEARVEQARAAARWVRALR